MSHLKFEIKDQDQTVSYIGQLIKKTKTRVTFETKFGTMDLPVEELVSLVQVNENDYIESQGPVKEKEPTIIHQDRPHGHREGNSKMNRAIELYKSMMVNGVHPKRKDVIDQFVSVIGMTPAGASTYQNTIKSQVK
jgi:hypothetical protein